MAKTYKIAVIPGDGTGPEVVNEGLKVLQAAQAKFGFKLETANFDFGGERYMRTGETLPDAAIDELRQFDAIFLGAIGHPDVKQGTLEKGILLKVEIPANSHASVCMPTDGKTAYEITESGAPVWSQGRYQPGKAGILSAQNSGDSIQFEVGSGSYVFELK
jgi:isocitrate/isopropylmalate dehydrogenase